MFAFFVNDEFKGFWANKEGDIFADITCLSMNWEKSLVDLVFYPDLKPLPDHYNFDNHKNLSLIRTYYTDQEVISDEGVATVESVEITEVYRTCSPVYYVQKGLMLKNY